MDKTSDEKISESPSSVLLQVMSRFAHNSCENENQNVSTTEAYSDYSALPDECNQLEEEISLLKEILEKQEQTYYAEKRDYKRQIQNYQSQLQESKITKALLDKKAKHESHKSTILHNVIQEYIHTVEELMKQKSKLEENHVTQMENLEKELYEHQESLSVVERKFAELHKRYESKKKERNALREQIEGLKYNLRLSQVALEKNELAYLELEKHAKEQIDKANQELNDMKQKHYAEIARLVGQSMKLELQIGSVEGTIKQKTKENEELSAIYDDCLNKVNKK